MRNPHLATMLEGLTPDVLRDRIVLPVAKAREAYEPRFHTTASSVEMDDEVKRFVDHMSRHLYLIHPDACEWPRLLVNQDTDDLLRRVGGRRPAMQLIDDGGIRRLLDVLAEHLQARRLDAHLDIGLLVPILALSPGDQIDLARDYLDEYRDLPGLEQDHPALVMLRWKEILHEHARIALTSIGVLK